MIVHVYTILNITKRKIEISLQIYIYIYIETLSFLQQTFIWARLCAFLDNLFISVNELSPSMAITNGLGFYMLARQHLKKIKNKKIKKNSNSEFNIYNKGNTNECL